MNLLKCRFCFNMFVEQHFLSEKPEAVRWEEQMDTGFDLVVKIFSVEGKYLAPNKDSQRQNPYNHTHFLPVFTSYYLSWSPASDQFVQSILKTYLKCWKDENNNHYLIRVCNTFYKYTHTYILDRWTTSSGPQWPSVRPMKFSISRRMKSKCVWKNILVFP